MTNEEALKCIEDVLNSDYHYDESLGYQLTSDDFEWLEKAKEALKKQIPKKPSLHSFSESYDTYTYFKCPNLCDIYCEVKNNMHFCSKCGQALDWSDTES